MPIIPIKNVGVGGHSDSDILGVPNSVYKIRNLDVYSEPGHIKINNKVVELFDGENRDSDDNPLSIVKLLTTSYNNLLAFYENGEIGEITITRSPEGVLSGSVIRNAATKITRPKDPEDENKTLDVKVLNVVEFFDYLIIAWQSGKDTFLKYIQFVDTEVAAKKILLSSLSTDTQVKEKWKNLNDDKDPLTPYVPMKVVGDRCYIGCGSFMYVLIKQVSETFTEETNPVFFSAYKAGSDSFPGRIFDRERIDSLSIINRTSVPEQIEFGAQGLKKLIFVTTTADATSNLRAFLPVSQGENFPTGTKISIEWKAIGSNHSSAAWKDKRTEYTVLKYNERIDSLTRAYTSLLVREVDASTSEALVATPAANTNGNSTQTDFDNTRILGNTSFVSENNVDFSTDDILFRNILDGTGAGDSRLVNSNFEITAMDTLSGDIIIGASSRATQGGSALYRYKPGAFYLSSIDPLPEKNITAFFKRNGKLFFFAGEHSTIYFFDGSDGIGYKKVPIRRNALEIDNVKVNPHSVVGLYNNIYFGVGIETLLAEQLAGTNIPATYGKNVDFGIYSIGNYNNNYNDIINFDFDLLAGNNYIKSIQSMIVYNNSLLIAAQVFTDGTVSIDDSQEKVNKVFFVDIEQFTNSGYFETRWIPLNEKQEVSLDWIKIDTHDIPVGTSVSVFQITEDGQEHSIREAPSQEDGKLHFNQGFEECHRCKIKVVLQSDSKKTPNISNVYVAHGGDN